MTIAAQVIEDSISPQGIRLTTMQLRYPRLIHSEFMTHRAFSRNASSSRAIPVERMIADLRRDPAMPVYWGSNKPGMQAGAELEMHKLLGVKCVWVAAMEDAIAHAEALMGAGLHKQIANRILEPWAHINVVVTATDWQNFYDLRRHPDAQPEIHELADAMWAAQQASSPNKLLPNEWHVPYVSLGELHSATMKLGQDKKAGLEAAIKVSVARCARVSYLTHDGRKTTIEEDVALYDKLVGSVPLHASPAEHQATPDEQVGPDDIEPRPRWKQGYLHGNLRGWKQYRRMLEFRR